MSTHGMSTEVTPSVTPSELSLELRTGNSDSMQRRRKVVGLSLVAAGAMGLITAYQTGIIKHLPEPPLSLLDADKVDASSEAYAKLSTPDGILGLGSYAVTMGLAAMGGSNRAIREPWIPLALAAKVAVDTINAGKLTVDQWTKHRAFCSYCLLSAAVTFAMVPLVVPDARTAFRELTRELTS